MNEDEIDRQFSVITGGLESSSLLVDGWHVSELEDDNSPPPGERGDSRRLGTLRLLVGVSIILTLSAGWLGAAGGLTSGWAAESVVTYWLTWVFLVVPLTALAVAKLAVWTHRGR